MRYLILPFLIVSVLGSKVAWGDVVPFENSSFRLTENDAEPIVETLKKALPYYFVGANHITFNVVSCGYTTKKAILSCEYTLFGPETSGAIVGPQAQELYSELQIAGAKKDFSKRVSVSILTVNFGKDPSLSVVTFTDGIDTELFNPQGL